MPKIGRLSRGCTVTEKIDGTNGSIFIQDIGDGTYFFVAGSRTRWITPGNDNYGFAKWAWKNADELLKLGPGHHFGEWWGSGIQRNYGLKEKRFSLFNTNRWSDDKIRPACCGIVPVIYEGLFTAEAIDNALTQLRLYGSIASPRFMLPEGIVVYHHATKTLFKKTIDKDESPKGLTECHITE